MKDCKYPNCQECDLSDCNMEQNDIQALLKRRARRINPIQYSQKQAEYKKEKREKLPHCNNCKDCILVRKEKGEDYRRLCILEMRLIEQKITSCPNWCMRREYNSDYLNRREKMLKQKKEDYKRLKMKEG